MDLKSQHWATEGNNGGGRKLLSWHQQFAVQWPWATVLPVCSSGQSWFCEISVFKWGHIVLYLTAQTAVCVMLVILWFHMAFGCFTVIILEFGNENEWACSAPYMFCLTLSSAPLETPNSSHLMCTSPGHVIHASKNSRNTRNSTWNESPNVKTQTSCGKSGETYSSVRSRTECSVQVFSSPSSCSCIIWLDTAGENIQIRPKTF